ncbi:peptide deformylase [Streptomyces sporangiiformans]|uniref:peptide deformylase n=1 Tax=Streptomyces sporangiiformans TaxID=2315329 RepID=UPI001F09A32A|nr:peptide deformylase [Streptomyces sporangiiformans]
MLSRHSATSSGGSGTGRVSSGGRGVVQHGAPVLTEPARPIGLPAERDAAEQTVEMLFAHVERIARVHHFAKGKGIAAPQIGIGRERPSSNPPRKAPTRSCCSTPASPPPQRRPTSSTKGVCPGTPGARVTADRRRYGAGYR